MLQDDYIKTDEEEEYYLLRNDTLLSECEQLRTNRESVGVRWWEDDE